MFARRASREPSMPEPIGDSRLIERPGHLIRQLHQISFARFLDQAKAFDVKPVQYAALVAINRHPGIDQTTLCNFIALDRTTIGDVVGRLQRKKLITRVNGAHDRRTKALHITPAGRRLIRDIEPAVQATQRLILEPPKARARRALKQILNHLVRPYKAQSPAPWRPRDKSRRPRSRGVS